MGTRSITRFRDIATSEPFAAFYRQFDGYIEGHGKELAKICNVRICNGIRGSRKNNKLANGIPCLAATVVRRMKAGIGNIYLHAPDTDTDHVQYVYDVFADGKPCFGRDVNVTIRVTEVGHAAFHFNGKDHPAEPDKVIFEGSPKQLIARAQEIERAEAKK